MARLDNTAHWFEQGENAEAMADTLSIGEDDSEETHGRRRVPTLVWIIGGVAVTLVGFCEVLTHVAHASRGPEQPQLPSLAIVDREPKPKMPEPSQLASLPPATITSMSAPVANPAPAASTNAPAAASAPAASAPARRAAAPVKARAAVARVAKVSPDVVAGEKLLKRGRAGQALAKFQQQIARSPDDVRALRGACLSLADLGRLNEAARVCRRALDRAPDDLTTRRSLATIYYNGGAYKWSATEWRHVVAQDPKDQHAKKALRLAEARS